MNNYRIITDSSCDLSQELVDALDILVLPLYVTVDGSTYGNYPDERELTAKDFYQMLRSEKHASTSAVNMDAFDRIMRPVLEAGEDVLYLGFSSALSSTYSAGAAAAAELREEFADRKIYTVDTLAASLGQGLLVYGAAKLRQEGASIEQVRDFVENNKLNLAHWFTVDDLHHLKRGGRVSAATAVIGTALNIKPVLHVDDEGKLISVSKARGRKNAIKALLSRMEETVLPDGAKNVFISHGDCIEDANYLAGLIEERFSPESIVINNVGPVIGAHSGPGTLALFFYAENR